MPKPSAPTGARARARAQITGEIIDEARRQLAADGPAGLSLRAIARELGMVSSAIYRYFPSRDALLTALIIEAYDSLGEAAEDAAAKSNRRAPANRWVDVAMAIRTWALDHPSEYALVYGSPVPGYRAPDETSISGTRASLALVGVVRDAAAARTEPLSPTLATGDLPASVRSDLSALRTAIDMDLPDNVLHGTLLAWTQLFGLLTFERFNQTRGVITDHESFFRASAAAMADAIGL